MDAFEAITKRTSVRRFTNEPVAREAIARLLDAAVRAPNHKLTEPWRFAVLTGRARDRYAELRRAHKAKKVEDPAKLERTYREALDTPAFVIVIQKLDADTVRREEDYAAVMMAIQNLLIAATALGLGTFLKTGGMMRQAELRSMVGAGDDEAIVGLVSLGHPAADGPPVRRAPAGEKTTWLG